MNKADQFTAIVLAADRAAGDPVAAKTGMACKAFAPIHGTPMEKTIEDQTPMGRLGTSKEIGDVIAFVCGPKASYMTGSEVYVDGGWTAA